MPLFFLPYFSKAGIDSFAKAQLLWAIGPILFFLLLIKKINSDRFTWKRTALDLPIIIFLLILFFSCTLGFDSRVSFWGAQSGSHLSFFTYLSLASVYFFLVNFIKSQDQVVELMKLSIIAYVIPVIILIPSLLGTWLGFFSMDSFLYKSLFSAFGSFEDIALYFVFMNLILIIMLFQEKSFLKFSKWSQVLFKVLFFVSFVFIIFINSLTVWTCFLLGNLLIYALNYKKEVSKKQIHKRAFFIILSIIFISLNLFTPNSGQARKDQVHNFELNLRDSAGFVAKSLRQDTLLGVGLENVDKAFLLHRDAKMNLEDSWYIRFNKTNSYASDLLVSTGVMGLASFVYIIIIILVNIFKIFKRGFIAKFEIGDQQQIKISAGLLLISVFLVFTYSINILFLFLFFIFSAMFFSSLSKEREFAILNKQPHRKILEISTYLLIFLFLIFLSFNIKYAIAECYYQSSTKHTEAEKKETFLIKASSLNKNEIQYQLTLAKYYKDTALSELKENTEKENMIKVEDYINKSINITKSVIAKNPNSAFAHETLGTIYRDLGESSPDSLELAIIALQNAQKLEPTNPVIENEIGVLFLKIGDFESAERSLKNAVSLKDNYYQAKYNLSHALSGQEKLIEAKEILKSLEGNFNKADVDYELGRVYYNLGEYKNAIKKLNEVIGVTPNYANALYVLGLSYEKTDDTKKALELFKKIEVSNPDNTEIKKKIEELSK